MSRELDPAEVDEFTRFKKSSQTERQAANYRTRPVFFLRPPASRSAARKARGLPERRPQGGHKITEVTIPITGAPFVGTANTPEAALEFATVDNLLITPLKDWRRALFAFLSLQSACLKLHLGAGRRNTNPRRQP